MSQKMNKKEMTEFVIDQIISKVNDGGAAYIDLGVWKINIEKSKGKNNQSDSATFEVTHY